MEHTQVGPGRGAGGGQARAGLMEWLSARPHRYVLMNAGEPLNEVEAEQMMKEADKDGDGTIDYEGEWAGALGASGWARASC